jgi:hypothetical protein
LTISGMGRVADVPGTMKLGQAKYRVAKNWTHE